MQVFTTMLGLHIIIAIIAALVLAKFIYSSDYLIGRYLQIESQFLINLNAENLAAAAQKRASARHGMWLDEQFYTCAYEIQPGSPWIGWSIRRLDVHRNYKILLSKSATSTVTIRFHPGIPYCAPATSCLLPHR